MKHAVAALLAVLALVGCQGSESAERPTSSAAEAEPETDVDVLLAAIEEMHPNPWHDIAEEEFRAAAAKLEGDWPGLAEHERLVELMRLLGLLGERDGHTGIHSHESAHAYPVYVYAFSDGIHVAASIGHDDLVGARLVAVEETPAEEVLEAVRPLVGRDNDWSQLMRATALMITPEVLHGLGIVHDMGPAAFTLDLPDGATRDVELEPIPFADYLEGLHGAFPMFPDALPARDDLVALQNLDQNLWLTKLDGGRALYVGYHHTIGATSAVADRLLRLARDPPVERIVVDVRQNGGGDNTTYGPLLHALSSPEIDRPGRLYALIGRATFSAAGNFVTELERETGAVLVGEPTGGAPNQYGDSETVPLPETGWTAYLPVVYVEKSDPDDPRVAVEPDVPVAWSAEDFFAGRDPALSAALRRAPR
ncbi:MAG: hypothetical protein ACRDNI_12365 [Gaiellaceae bacterium]